MSKEIKQCKVCHKKKEEPCAHVGCPNRKPVTAQVPDGATGYQSPTTKINHTMPCGSEGSFRAEPKFYDEE